MNSVMLAALIARDGGIAAGRRPLARRSRPHPPRDRRRGGIGRRRPDLGRQLDGSRGPRPRPRRRAGRAGRPRRRPPTGGAGGDRLPRRASPGRPPAGQPRQLPLCLRLLRRPDRPPPGRPSPRDWPYRPVSLPLARKLASVVGRVDYAGSGSCTIGSSRWPSAARRSCRARPAPTASSSSRPTWKATRSGRPSPSGSTTTEGSLSGEGDRKRVSPTMSQIG